MKFDFEYWMNLHEEDPNAFERERSEVVEDLIENARYLSSRRLKGMQFKIDMERSRSSTPMDACLRLNTMMMDDFHNSFAPTVRESNLGHLKPLSQW